MTDLRIVLLFVVLAIALTHAAPNWEERTEVAFRALLRSLQRSFARPVLPCQRSDYNATCIPHPTVNNTVGIAALSIVTPVPRTIGRALPIMQLPTELGYLTDMTSLRIVVGHGRIGGSLPSEIGSLTQLEMLYLKNVSLNAPIPRELGNLAPGVCNVHSTDGFCMPCYRHHGCSVKPARRCNPKQRKLSCQTNPETGLYFGFTAEFKGRPANASYGTFPALEATTLAESSTPRVPATNKPDADTSDANRVLCAWSVVLVVLANEFSRRQ